MFTSAQVNWLDKVDPYHIQRQALQKALFVATVMVFIYWIYLPVNFSSFVAGIILIALYESPNFVSYQEKDSTIFFIVATVIFCSVTFYLLYLYHYIFLLYFICTLSIVYFLILNYYPKIKNISMLIFAVSTITLTQRPEGVSQIAIDIFSGLLLSYVTMYICLKLFPNYYFKIWKKALQKYITCLEIDIQALLNNESRLSLVEEVVHIDILIAYQRLVPSHYISPSYRLYVGMRNIHFALNNLSYETSNHLFWQSVILYLQELRNAINANVPLNEKNLVLEVHTPLQHHVAHDLNKGFILWNRLCAI